MWCRMESAQQMYCLSERLIRAITHWNTLSCCTEDVQDLLNKGADVNRLHGILLPLHCACMVADPYVTALLIQHGAQVNVRDGYGRAAIHYAAERDEECVDILLDNGAEVNMVDDNEDTALHWAAYKNKAQCVRTLLERGALVNAKDYNENTPLNWASQKGNLQSIKILLEYNADVTISSYRGHTPIMRLAGMQASGLGDAEDDDACLELLIKASGQFSIADENGQIPDLVRRDNKMRELLLPYVSCVRKLQDLCRFKIRNYMGRIHLPTAIYKLPLPQRLQQFVLLQTEN